MSEFEAACWNWYQDRANTLTFRSGALGRFIVDEAAGMAEVARSLFLSAVGKIYLALETVGAERAEKKVGSWS